MTTLVAAFTLGSLSDSAGCFCSSISVRSTTHRTLTLRCSLPLLAEGHHRRFTVPAAVSAVCSTSQASSLPLGSSLFTNSGDGYTSNASAAFGHSACLSASYTSTCSSLSGRRRFKVFSLFGLGMPELVVIAGVAVLLFGPKKLPEIGKSLGKTMKSFQQAADEFKAELKEEQESSMPSSGVHPAESISEENTEKKM